MLKNDPVNYLMNWAIVIACAVSGLLLTEQVMPFLNMTFLADFEYRNIAEVFVVIFGGGMAGAIAGWIMRGKIVKYVNSLSEKIETNLRDTPVDELIGASLGVAAGLVIVNLFAIVLWQIPYVGTYLPLFLSIAAAYICGSVGKSKGLEIIRAFRKLGSVKGSIEQRYFENKKVVDTSVIIDGRIEDIFKAGFIDGVLVVPGFVIKEIQMLADSANDQKRKKGRNALDTLNRLRQEFSNMIKVDNTDYSEMREVDLKLLRYARDNNAKILTVDYNLNKVAILHGIFVLNINELANAVKSNITNGETLVVRPLKAGKEKGQSVCYFDDGTMVVVEDGADCIGKDVEVVVHSVFQTPAGRMIFAKIKQ